MSQKHTQGEAISLFPEDLEVLISPGDPQLEAHPRLRELLETPFAALLDLAIRTTVDLRDLEEGVPGDPRAAMVVSRTALPYRENSVAVEAVLPQAAQTSWAAVHAAQYKGPPGVFATPPRTSWAISCEVDRGRTTYYHWDQDRDGGSAALFALGGTDCIEVDDSSLPVEAMKSRLGLAMYERDHPNIAAELGIESRIPPFKLLESLQESELRRHTPRALLKDEADN
ncbi:MAG TPA: hypothetical protein VLF69_04470 [Candidatus Saccharimonadales bacterium]|nr:hypothetical protein [Candidatus Saccharimonadales bacterium]